MIKLMLIVATIALCCLNRANANEPIYMSGIMMAPCSTITTAIGDDTNPKTDPYAMSAINWAAGYMTHLNISLMAEGQPMYELNSKSALELWYLIFHYCKINPQALGIQAVSTVVTGLPRSKGKTR